MAGSCGCPGREDTSPCINIHTALVFWVQDKERQGEQGSTHSGGVAFQLYLPKDQV